MLPLTIKLRVLDEAHASAASADAVIRTDRRPRLWRLPSLAWHRRSGGGRHRSELAGIRGGDTDTYQTLANSLDGLFDRLASPPTSRVSVRDALREAFDDEGLEIGWRRDGG